MGAKASLNCDLIFNACSCALYALILSACLWSASNNIKMKIVFFFFFFSFGRLISNAEVENAMISDYIIVCSDFSI